MPSTMSSVTVIGRATRIIGRVTGAVDLEIQGYVEGEIAVGGDVTIDAQGLVGASVRGRNVLVRGAVRGDLVGEESVLLESGARVVGDVRAPRVAVAPGAFVRGYVQTGDVEAPAARASRAQPAGRPVVVPARAAQPPQRAVSPANAPAPAAPVAAAARPQPAPVAAAAPKDAPSKPRPVEVAVAVSRRPPPPVVPALRSAKGQIAKKKER
jgi:cytoskeletal protein CcmA (bactofilin family)